MAPRPLRGPYRRWALAVAALVSTLLVGTLLQPSGSTAAAAMDSSYTLIHGWPGTQAGLKVWRSNCDNGELPGDDWRFDVVRNGPLPFGPEAIGWIPKDLGGAYGIETYFPSAPDVDVFQIEAYSPSGQTSGYAQVNYYPRPGNVDFIGVTPDFVDTQDGWHTIDASNLQYDWYRLVDDEYDGTVVQDQTIEQMTNTYGAGAAWFSMYLGCDGNPFYVDGYQVGSTVSGWNAFDFEDFFHVNVSLRVRGGPISTCHTSPARFPNPVSFKGRITPGAAWQGQQFVGRRNGRWRIVARGASANIAFSERVNENSYFDAVHPGSVNTAFNHSEPDNYVPAFPSITLRTNKRTVRKGQRMVFTGSLKPARRMSYTVLRAVENGRRWTRFQSLGTRKTDARGRFRFTVRTPEPGWARINILTKTEKDLTSTINPNAIVYEVLKPKKKKRKPPPSHGPAPQPQLPDPDPVDPEPGPLAATAAALRSPARVRQLRLGADRRAAEEPCSRRTQPGDR